VIQLSEQAPAFQNDWQHADTHIGGHPAISLDPYVDKGNQHLGWTVRAFDTGLTLLGIDAAMPAAAEPALRPQLDEFLAAIELQDAAPTDAP